MIEVRVGAPVERVWSALRDREELRRWHGWDHADLDAEIEQVYFTGRPSTRTPGRWTPAAP